MKVGNFMRSHLGLHVSHDMREKQRILTLRGCTISYCLKMFWVANKSRPKISIKKKKKKKKKKKNSQVIT